MQIDLEYVYISEGVNFGTCELPNDNLGSSFNTKVQITFLLFGYIITLSKLYNKIREKMFDIKYKLKNSLGLI